MIEINPLEVLNLRKLDTMPPHFSKMRVFEKNTWGNDLETWIRSKLKGRYFVNQQPSIGDDGKLRNFTFVGFEIQSELTHFILAWPHLRRN